MPSDQQQITNLEAEVDALSSPTTAQVRLVSRDYDADIVAASALRQAASGGGGSQQIEVTLTTVDVTGPAEGAAFTIAADTLADQGTIRCSIVATWTTTPYTTLYLKANSETEVLLADQVFPTDDVVPGQFSVTLIRVGDSLIWQSTAPPIPGSWILGRDDVQTTGWHGNGIVATGLDFTQDVDIGLLVALNPAEPGVSYWEPTAAYCVADPLGSTVSPTALITTGFFQARGPSVVGFSFVNEAFSTDVDGFRFQLDDDGTVRMLSDSPLALLLDPYFNFQATGGIGAPQINWTLTGLTTVEPGDPGKVWNDSGTLKIT